jgi:hypothetical protein
MVTAGNIIYKKFKKIDFSQIMFSNKIVSAAQVRLKTENRVFFVIVLISLGTIQMFLVFNFVLIPIF